MNVSFRRCLSLAVVPALLAGCSNRPKPDGSGTIECTQVRIAPEVGGRIAAIKFREGDAVGAGQVMAEIDPTPYLLKRDEAKAALAQAQAQLDLMLAGSREEDTQRAREQVREARARAEAAAVDARRIEEVFANGSATAKQRDDSKAAAEQTAALLAAAEQNLSKLAGGNRKEEIRAAQAALDLSRARLAQAEKAVADCVVKTPATGTVTTRNMEPGEIVSAGTPLATVSRLDDTWLSVYIPESRLSRVKLGGKASVKLDGDPASYEGTITFVSPEAEFTPRNVQTPDERAKLVYRIKISLPNPKGLFKPGMPADGYLKQM